MGEECVMDVMDFSAKLFLCVRMTNICVQLSHERTKKRFVAEFLFRS